LDSLLTDRGRLPPPQMPAYSPGLRRTILLRIRVVDRVSELPQLSANGPLHKQSIEPTYPDVSTIEVSRSFAGACLAASSVLLSDRGTLRTRNLSVAGHVSAAPLKALGRDLSGLRGPLDYEEDLHFAREVYALLYRGRSLEWKRFSRAALKTSIARPTSTPASCEISGINSHCNATQ